MKKLTPAVDLLLPSIEAIRQNLLNYFVLSVLPLLLMTYGSRNAETIGSMVTPFSVAGVLLSFLFISPLYYVMNKASKGEQVQLTEAFTKGYKFFWRLLGLSIVFGFLLIFGLILFIIPGIIVLRRYYLSFYYLVDQDLDIKTAMKKSANSSKQNYMAVYSIIGVSLLFGFFGIIPGIGTVIGTIMQFLYSVAPALRYQEMKKAYPKA